MAGVVHVPWYATGFRADKLEVALADIASIAPRYGATSYQVFRFRDDRYKFLQTAAFTSKEQWESYWYGPEFVEFRVLTSELVPGPGALRLDRPRGLGLAGARCRDLAGRERRLSRCTPPSTAPCASWGPSAGSSPGTGAR